MSVGNTNLATSPKQFVEMSPAFVKTRNDSTYSRSGYEMLPVWAGGEEQGEGGGPPALHQGVRHAAHPTLPTAAL